MADIQNKSNIFAVFKMLETKHLAQKFWNFILWICAVLVPITSII